MNRATTFRCLRNFRFAGRDCRVGEELNLTDEQAKELVGLGDTVEPVSVQDRQRIHAVSHLQWETSAEANERRVQEVHEPMRRVGSWRY